MYGYFYVNSNCKDKDKVENCNENDYIKSLKEQIRVLKAQIDILRADNNRLIKMLEKSDKE